MGFMPGPYKKHLFICTNNRDNDPQSSCRIKGGVEVHKRFKERLKELGLSNEVRANQAGCLDACAQGVTMVIYPEQIWYGGVKVEDVDEIIQKSVIGNQVVERLKIA